MKHILKRSFALLMALVMCICLLPTIRLAADAVEFEYTYDSTGKYIYNWGTRGQTATSLSPNAEKFYTTTTYEALSANPGGTGASDAPSSALYAALKTLMTDAHDYQTSYDATRGLFQYTDCQNSGNPSTISSFYSGVAIGPGWDGGSTWNREHTWPNSKGDASGNGENDIMMLRPAATSENSSRGNKAYGVSAGFYNPNGASNGLYDLRGDVARIMLYVYVRWGNTGAMWGSGGVIESLELLLEWMEADPVDTWELGRNDSVEAITGTRNVFVDYPELAFLLFGAEIPSDMVTPSGTAAGGTSSCKHNYVAGEVVPATCTAEGYTVYTCSLCGGSYHWNYVEKTAHSYVDGFCSVCGAEETVGPEVPTDPVEIVKAAYALAEGAVLPYNATLTGVITYVDKAYNSTYQNISVTICVSGAENMPIQCYNLCGEGVDTLNVNDVITVTGSLKNYYGIIEFDAGCTLDAVTQMDPPAVSGNSATYVFSNYKSEAAGENEEKALDENVSLLLSKGFWSGELRIYQGSNAIIKSQKPITSMTVYAGHKDSTFNVLVSADGTTWTSYQSGINYTTAYSEITVDLGAAGYRYVKIDAPGAQIRIKSMTLTFAGDSVCEHTNIQTLEAVPATCTQPGLTEGSKCLDCGATLTAQTETPATGHTYVDGSCTVCGEAQPSAGEKTTATVIIADYAAANGWVNEGQYPTVLADDVITITASAGQYTGKYYSSNTTWRIYQADTATLTVTAADGATIISVKITYSVSNNGILTFGSEQISSGTTVDVNAASAVFGVGNTGTKTNGQVRITAIEVVYAGAAETPACQHTSFTYAATLAPQANAAGTLTATCTGCGKQEEITLPVLNSLDYTFQMLNTPAGAASGTVRYTWKDTTYGEFSFETAFVYGDASGDGKANLQDLLLLRQYIANSDAVSGESTVAVRAGADANCDGKVNLLDVLLMRQYIANCDPVTGESSVALGPQ